MELSLPVVGIETCVWKYPQSLVVCLILLTIKWELFTCWQIQFSILSWCFCRPWPARDPSSTFAPCSFCWWNLESCPQTAYNLSLPSPQWARVPVGTPGALFPEGILVPIVRHPPPNSSFAPGVAPHHSRTVNSDMNKNFRNAQFRNHAHEPYYTSPK